MTAAARTTALALAGALSLALLAVIGQAGWRLVQAAELARQSRALQQSPPDPALRLLIVGDSTAVGTGASAPAASLAGRIAADHPRLRVDNRGRDGATWAELPAQFDGAGRHDLVLVMAGGNDVIRWRDLDQVRADVERVLRLAARHADQVVLMPAGNVGNAPFFFWPLSTWMSDRSRELHRIVQDAATRHGAVYVDLFRERENDPFAQRRDLNAADGLHPSDAGYARWFDVLRRQADLDRRLAPAR